MDSPVLAAPVTPSAPQMISRRPHKKLTGQQKAEIIKLWHAGEKGEYIAAMAGCSVTAVFGVCAKAGLHRGKGHRTALKPALT